jgi:hypothetical protein
MYYFPSAMESSICAKIIIVSIIIIVSTIIIIIVSIIIIIIIVINNLGRQNGPFSCRSIFCFVE